MNLGERAQALQRRVARMLAAGDVVERALELVRAGRKDDAAWYALEAAVKKLEKLKAEATK